MLQGCCILKPRITPSLEIVSCYEGMFVAGVLQNTGVLQGCYIIKPRFPPAVKIASCNDGIGVAGVL